MSCEQVLAEGYKLKSDITETFKSGNIYNCSKKACQENSLGYTYNTISTNCDIYDRPNGIVFPFPTTNIMELSDPSDITGLFQKAKVGSIVPYLIGSFVIIFIIFIISKREVRVLNSILTLLILCLAMYFLILQSNKKMIS